MRLYKIVSSIAILGLAGVMTFSRCTAVDDSLGEGFGSGEEQMKLGTASFDFSPDASRPFFETRLFHTDSVRASNIGQGYLGAMNDATFGSRRAGLFTQYRAVALSDLDGFGYRPIFDSIQLKISVVENAGDTLRPIKYNVYEIVSNDYLEKSEPDGDTLFYATFDPLPYLDPDPIFSFTYPDGTADGPREEYITMQPTENGLGLIRRLMLLEGKYKDDMTIYEKLELWTDYFKGVYIEPAEQVTDRGNLFATDLKGSGFLMYMRNRNETDPALIQDTITASYAFRTTSTKYGNASINVIRHDYTGSQIDFAAADENNEDRPLTQILHVEGMNGVISELTFTDALFEAMLELYEGEEAPVDETGGKFTGLALNRAELRVYVEGGSYDWANMDAGAISPVLDRSLRRLGMYTDYKELTGIKDYYFTYEKAYAGSGFVLPYGGYLNRSKACYVMDISNYLQSVWNEWLAAEDKSTVERTIYIGPEAYGLYTMPQTTLQGMEGGTNNAPIQLDLTYTLIK